MINYTAFMLSPVIIEFIFILFHKKSVSLVPALRKRYVIILGIILFFMIGFVSENVGAGDSHFYVKNWEMLRKTSLAHLIPTISKIDIEFGFEIWVWINAHIFQWSQFIFILYGAFVSFTICRFLYLNVKDLCLGFVMFSTLGLFGFMVQGIRQGFAICFCILAIEMSKNRRLVWFLVFVGLAMMFHSSAIAFIPVYFLPLLKINIRSLLIFVAALVLALLFLDRIFLLMNIVINDHYAIGDTDKTQGGFITLAIYIIILIAAWILLRKKDNIGMFFFMVLIAMVTFAIRYGISGISQRITYYYTIGECVLLSEALYCFEKRQRILFRSIAIMLCLGIALYKASYSVLIPYNFFWQS